MASKKYVEQEKNDLSKISFFDAVPIYKFIMHCHECSKAYSRENPPFLISCGHSLCLSCKNQHRNKIFNCERCFTKSPSLGTATLNYSLLEQIETISKDRKLLKFIKNYNNNVDIEPLTKIQEEFCLKEKQFEFLNDLFSNNDKLGNADLLQKTTQRYAEIVREFTQKANTSKISTSLRRLADEIEKIERGIEKIKKIGNINENIPDTQKLFFSKFGMTEIPYSHSNILYLIENGFKVYSRLIWKKWTFHAELKLLDSGLHLNCFRSGLPDDKLGYYFKHSDFVGLRQADPKQLFLDLETSFDGKMVEKRIYISTLPNQNSMYFTGYLTGEQGVGYKGAYLIKKGTNLVVDSMLSLADGDLPPHFQLCGEDEKIHSSVAGLLVCFRARRMTDLFKICMSDDKRRKDYCNKIGIITSGMQFLKRIEEKCLIKNTGAVFESNKTILE